MRLRIRRLPLLMLDALDGKELVRIPTGASFRARFKYPYIIVHRIDLHNVLLDAARQNDAIELVPERDGDQLRGPRRRASR